MAPTVKDDVPHRTSPNTVEVRNKSLINCYLRSLTPDLADKDPFQAAMGLVFLSKLGLEWDYSLSGEVQSL
jgi:hypothetical protein